MYGLVRGFNRASLKKPSPKKEGAREEYEDGIVLAEHRNEIIELEVVSDFQRLLVQSRKAFSRAALMRHIGNCRG